MKKNKNKKDKINYTKFMNKRRCRALTLVAQGAFEEAAPICSERLLRWVKRDPKKAQRMAGITLARARLRRWRRSEDVPRVCEAYPPFYTGFGPSAEARKKKYDKMLSVRLRPVPSPTTRPLPVRPPWDASTQVAVGAFM